MKPVIVGIGEILWDLLPDGKQLGGAVANFAFHAQKLGGKGLVVSCIGKDKFGDEIIENLTEHRLDSRFLVVDNQHPTGTVSVDLDKNGQPTYIIHENVAWDFIPYTPKYDELAKFADVVCFGSLAQRREVSRKSIHSFLNQTKSDAVKIFDINLRQHFYSKDVISKSLEFANVLKINDEELPVLLKMFELDINDELKAITYVAKKYNLKMVVLTKGAQGSILYSEGKSSTHSGYKTKIIDTVGAGDAFTGAMAMGILKGMSLDKINNYANKVASFVCSQAGGTPDYSAEMLT